MMNRVFLLGVVCSLVCLQTPSSASVFNERDGRSFSLKVAPSTLTLLPNQGGSVSVTVSAKCKVPVTFSASGFPAGVNYTFTPTTSKTGSTLAVFAPTATPVGSYTINIAGTSGKSTAFTSMTLVISGPNFSVSAPGDTLTLTAGTATTVPITVNPGPGFTGTVTFGLSGLPAGVTATFTPPSSTTGSTLAISASLAAIPGSYSVILSGTSGGETASASGTLVIAAGAPNFSISAPGDTLTLARGTGTTVPITVTPGTGFTGTVTFGITGLPAGVTATFQPASSTTGTTLSITAGASTAVGSYSVTLTGTSEGTIATAAGTLIIQ